MPSLKEFAKINVTLNFTPIGPVSAGKRVDVLFEGTATSDHWEGERPVAGIDRITIGADGIQNLDITARLGAGREIVSYRATGRGVSEAGIVRELMTFETAIKDLAWLNSAVGVAIGKVDGNKLALDVFLVEDD